MTTRPTRQLPVLVADIGGTHARFALADGDAVGAAATVAVADFAGPAEAALAFLSSHHRPPVARAVFALAAPVDGDCVRLTNAGWVFERAALAAALGLPVAAVHLLNDFEALALALPALRDDELLALGDGRAEDSAPRLVLGPGTGLGVAGLLRTGHGWQALPGEGGHQTLMAGDERESAILTLARREFSHVSAERLLSGSGLPLLHRLLGEVEGRAAAPLDTPQLIAGARNGDAACLATFNCFAGWLGAVAGNLALAFGARGGVYLGGGIPRRCPGLFAASPFRERFVAKGRFADYLSAVPTSIILAETPALRGAARFGREDG